MSFHLQHIVEYLRKQEWSMGNGQCPECKGHNPDGRWDGHPCAPKREMHGHEPDCLLYKALLSTGELIIVRIDFSND